MVADASWGRNFVKGTDNINTQMAARLPWTMPRRIALKYNPERQNAEEINRWYQIPMLRGRRDADPLHAQDEKRKPEVVLPWDLKYFSPMLRG